MFILFYIVFARNSSVVNSATMAYGIAYGFSKEINNNLRGLFGYHTVQGKPQETSCTWGCKVRAVGWGTNT